MQKLVASIVCLTAAATLATAGGQKGGKIEGTWKATSAIARGKKVPDEEVQKAMVLIMFKDGKYTVSIAGKQSEAGSYKTDASTKPATIDLTVTEGRDKGNMQMGIYKVEGDKLTVAMASNSKKGSQERPKTFDGQGTDEVTIFERVK